MGGKQSKQCLKDEEDFDETPLTEEGHCNIYDAALIGDWDRLIKLCTTSVIFDDDKEIIDDDKEIIDDGCNGD